MGARLPPSWSGTAYYWTHAERRGPNVSAAYWTNLDHVGCFDYRVSWLQLGCQSVDDSLTATVRSRWNFRVFAREYVLYSACSALKRENRPRRELKRNNKSWFHPKTKSNHPIFEMFPVFSERHVTKPWTTFSAFQLLRVLLVKIVLVHFLVRFVSTVWCAACEKLWKLVLSIANIGRGRSQLEEFSAHAWHVQKIVSRFSKKVFPDA